MTVFLVVHSYDNFIDNTEEFIDSIWSSKDLAIERIKNEYPNLSCVSPDTFENTAQFGSVERAWIIEQEVDSPIFW